MRDRNPYRVNADSFTSEGLFVDCLFDNGDTIVARLTAGRYSAALVRYANVETLRPGTEPAHNGGRLF